MIITRPKTERRLPLEIACLWYISQCTTVGGLFHSAASHFTKVIKIEVRAVQQTLRDLVALGYLEEVEPRRRDDLNKFWIPATYRLLKSCDLLDGAPTTDLRTDAQVPLPAHCNAQVTLLSASNAHSKTKDLVPTCAPVRTVPLATSKSVLDSTVSIVKVVGSNEYGVGDAQVDGLRNTVLPLLQFKKCKSPSCWNEAVLNDFCGVHDGTPPVTFKPEPIEPLSAYPIGSRQPLDGFDNTRIPLCPFCTGRETVDWCDLNGRRLFEESCGAPACITANFSRRKKSEEVLSESWAQAEARRKREFERHDELQAKRELNAQNPAFDENGRLRPGLTYPASEFEEDLVPDCPGCITEGCDWTPDEKQETVKIHLTCGNPACDKIRAKVLEGQKEFDERVSEDETLTTREEGVV
jgi:hypothetical protein